jgi:hypothetical protein
MSGAASAIARIGARLCGWCSGGERRERGEVLDHPGIDGHRRSVVRAAVHHPVADPGDLAALEQLEAGLQDDIGPGTVIELACRPLAFDQLLAGRARDLHPRRGADLLDLPLEQQLVAGAVGVDRELDARRAGIEDRDATHAIAPSSFARRAATSSSATRTRRGGSAGRRRGW